MLLYGLYLLGYVGCLLFPRSFCYWVAHRVADFCCWRSLKDREAVRCNLATILGNDRVPHRLVREVFRNFGMYLVDFFRFDRLNSLEIQRLVQLDGMEQMRGALAKGRGAIGLTAHLGNYELAAAVYSLLGVPMHGVVLTHQNPWVDAFFTRQRARVGVKGIPVQRLGRKAFLEASLSVFQRNEVLGLVGDRDFFEHGLELSLFGKPFRVPTGAASFSLRTGAPIIPTFLVRDSNGLYRMILEPPIPIPQGIPRAEALRQITEACLRVMARYIHRYPTQWYMFQEFWNPDPAVVL